MGCSSSTATGALEPTRKCYNYEILHQLCITDRGAFGCFTSKDNIERFIDIINREYDLILQYPIELSTIKKPTDYDITRMKTGKKIKHIELLLTSESKTMFLKELVKSTGVTGLKIFFKKFTQSNRSADNTFNRECLRLREQMDNFVIKSDQTDTPFNVSSLRFNPQIEKHYIQKLNKAGIPYTDLTAEYISFSIKRKDIDYGIPDDRRLRRIDFIFLELCNEGNLHRYKLKTLREFNKFIKTIITDLHHLHTQGIYHLDIKPDNIIKCTNRFKLIDYGLSVGLPIIPKNNKLLNKYIYNAFQQYRGTPDYINPIYQMVYIKYMEEPEQGVLSPFDISKITYYQRSFIDHYKEYIHKENIKGKSVEVFDIQRFISIKPDISFLKHFYSRADWYSLALTIKRIMAIKSGIVFDTKYNDGIQRLCNITDEELDRNDLHINLIRAFGLRLSSSR